MSTLDPAIYSGYMRSHLAAERQGHDLDPHDFWNGEDGGDYVEVVAWARLMGLRVLKTLQSGREGFTIVKPDAPHRNIPLCSPRALLEQLKRYAVDYVVYEPHP